jgi:plastocyanin
MTPVRRVAALGALWLAAACVSARADTVQISMENLEITPTVVSARLGDTVEWVNKDAFAHTTARNGDFDVTLPPRKTASVVLKKVGTVDYYCRYHPNMKATLKIEP